MCCTKVFGDARRTYSTARHSFNECNVDLQCTINRIVNGQIGNDTTAMELEQLINEYVASATNRGFRNGYEAAEEQFEW